MYRRRLTVAQAFNLPTPTGAFTVKAKYRITDIYNVCPAFAANAYISTYRKRDKYALFCSECRKCTTGHTRTFILQDRVPWKKSLAELIKVFMSVPKQRERKTDRHQVRREAESIRFTYGAEDCIQVGRLSCVCV